MQCFVTKYLGSVSPRWKYFDNLIFTLKILIKKPKSFLLIKQSIKQRQSKSWDYFTNLKNMHKTPEWDINLKLNIYTGLHLSIK